MTLPFRDNFLHLGVPWEVIREMEAQLTNPNFTQLFGGALGTNDATNPPFNASMNESGNIYRAVGNPFFSAANVAGNQIVGGIVLPAGAFDIAGRGLNLTSQGSFVTTTAKTLNLYANPTMSGQTITNGVISGGTVTAGTAFYTTTQTPLANTGWQVMVQIFKYGATGSNTQYAQGTVVNGATHGGINAPQFLTQIESAAMNLVWTISDATPAAGSFTVSYLELTGFN
jgi:hypothetical protein